MRNTRQRLRTCLISLNIYQDDQTLSVADQHLTTKIYIVLFVISLLTLLLLTGLNRQRRVVAVLSPSLETFNQLSDDYGSTLSCSCSQVSLRFETLITFHPRYHQICSSELISLDWIISLWTINDQSNDYFVLDYRLLASSQFQYLALLCQTVNDTVSDAVRQLHSSRLISSRVLSRPTFEKQMDILVEQMTTTVQRSFTLTNRILLLLIGRNRLISALRTNYRVAVIPIQPPLFQGSDNQYYNSVSSTSVCQCLDQFNCVFPSSFYTWTHPVKTNPTIWRNSSQIVAIPGIQGGCLPGYALLQSTLECFYQKTCLATVQSYTNAFGAVQPLNSSINSSIWYSNTTIGEMFQQLMIESWNNQSDFQAYYRECAPQSCTYSYQIAFYWIYMLATFIGLIGGLSASVNLIALGMRAIIAYLSTTCASSTIDQQHQTNDDHHNQRICNSLSVRERLAAFQTFIRGTLRDLNIFSQTESDLQLGIVSTRIYLLLIVISTVILTVYLSIRPDAQIVVIASPTVGQFAKLHEDYYSTLSCPCEHLSMRYSSIIDLRPHYHQICSSVFIRDDLWLQYWPVKYIDDSSASFSTYDFRLTGQSLFLLLQTFCQVASETVTNAIAVFNATELLNTHPLTEEQFFSRTSVLMANFISQTIHSFLVLLELLMNNIRNNQYAVFGATNAVYQVRTTANSSRLAYTSRTFDTTSDSCSCISSVQCVEPQGFYCLSLCRAYSNVSNSIVAGVVVGCYPLDSLLFSTLECFYNQTCVQSLIQRRSLGRANISTPTVLNTIQALDPTQRSAYPLTSPIANLLNNLFIETWSQSIDYQRYYAQCHPQICTYTFRGQNPIIAMVTTVIALLGGLSIILRILTPAFLKLFRCSFHRTRLPAVAYTPVVQRSLVQRCLSINFFPRRVPESNQLLASRLYLILFCLALTIIAVFISLQQQNQLITIDSPTEMQYSQLRSRHLSNLACPCSTISVVYSEFLNLSTTFHPVCSSRYLSSSWLQSLIFEGDVWNNADWFLLASYFRFLSTFCSFSVKTVGNWTKEFLSNDLISIEPLSLELFDLQVQSLLKTFIEQILSRFQRVNRFITDSFRANQFHNIYLTNWQPEISTADENYVFRSTPVSYNNGTCQCATGLSNCSRILTLKDYNEDEYHLAGFVAGCLPEDGFRQSTLECLFDQPCLDELLDIIYLYQPLLDKESTRFASNASMGSLVDELFIESWTNRANYSAYFTRCAPSFCQYSSTSRFSVIYIITSLLGFYGGLTVSLRTLVWYATYLVRCLLLRLQSSTRIEPCQGNH